MSARTGPSGPIGGGAPLENGGAARQAEIARDRAWICLPELREGRGAFRLFVEGDDLYDAMVAAIGRAEQDIRMESFIFAADEVGRRFAAALAAKARSGLHVRLHLDAFGAGFPAFRDLQRELEGAGVRFRWFHPFRWRRPLQYLQRNHRKLLVVDGREAFLGGFNIRRLNSRELHGETRQRDSHVRVAGELAALAAALFDQLWQHERPPRAEAIPEDATRLEALLVPSYSRHCRQRLACLHAGLIENARRHVYLTSPYFGPGTIVEAALRAAARRGVDVRLLVPRRGDPPVAGWATRAAYEPLLAAGVRIYEYMPRKLHAKTSAIDEEWGVIGSANLDYLSLFVNQELVLLARDRSLAKALDAQYQRDLEYAAEVTLALWRRRRWHERGLEAFGRSVRWLL
ncbi:phospholipase D-like domain-containing protein [Rhodoligotrophos defluvii]|uniref:phospholipase D-like domain-containing protein n=1 Tax=Rhodoligotrophos defluvii TaxID=2561934 RepID=UPI0010C94CE0|nr:phosphatidylserine/phosphatidylglycerophosphate/cardiolipin synthase family protein [Rhodoligotrophos defluvii]